MKEVSSHFAFRSSIEKTKCSDFSNNVTEKKIISYSAELQGLRDSLCIR